MRINNFFKQIKRIHFIAIGGVSNSALAQLFLSKGYIVSGSDCKTNDYIEHLKSLGVDVSIGHSEENISKDIDLVIYSLAIKEDNVELKKAKQLNIPCIKRGEALAIVSKWYKNIIAVAGMHGKTTTTAMVYHIFKEAGLNPTLHIGGEIDGIAKNVVIGGEEYFITEACEYGDSFLYLRPDVSVINNVEKEHLDYFKNINNIYKSFDCFMKRSKKCFVNCSCKQRLITTPASYIGKGSFTCAKNIKKQGEGYCFDVFIGEDFYNNFALFIAGKYNIDNALGAIAIANYYGVDKNVIADALKNFKGVKRRFEKVGRYNGHLVVFDYAHHPTEIKNAIQTAKSLNQGKVYVYFQPHTFSRTKSLKEMFLKSFKGADSTFICSTFNARESYDPDGDEKALATSLKNAGQKNVFYGDVKSIIEDLKLKKEKGILLFVGAGNMQNAIKTHLNELL